MVLFEGISNLVVKTDAHYAKFVYPYKARAPLKFS